MKKSKLLAPVLAIASIGAVVTPMVSLTSCKKDSGTQVLNYDQAKSWVESNYGETSEFEAPIKAVSSWNFSGEVTYRKTMTDYESYRGYITNHLGSLFSRLGQMTYEDAKATVQTGTDTDLTYTANSVNDFEIDNPAFSETNFTAPLCKENFDTYLNTYFYSVDAKRSVVFTTIGKTMKFSGTMSSISDKADGTGCDIFAMPDCTLTFNNEGKLISTEFSFKKYAESEYFWLSYKYVKYTDFFHFTVDEGGRISFKYTYKTK